MNRRDQIAEALRASHGQLRTVDEITDRLLPIVDRLCAELNSSYTDALRLIAGQAPHCETSTTEHHACRTPGSGRRRDAQYGADRWCDPCIAQDALEARYTTQTESSAPSELPIAAQEACPVCGHAIDAVHKTPSMAHGSCTFTDGLARCVFGPMHTIGYHHLTDGRNVATPPADALEKHDDDPPDEALVEAARRFIADHIATWEVSFAAGPGEVVSLSDAANAAARWHNSLASCRTTTADDSPAPCGDYSNGTDGWCCAATGPHDEHRNAAGDVRWGAA